MQQITRTPVLYYNKFSAPIPAKHELRGEPAISLVAFARREHADFVLLLAARTGFLLGAKSGAILPKDATLAHVDLDGPEIGNPHAIDFGIIPMQASSVKLSWQKLGTLHSKESILGSGSVMV